ncbi:MAG: UDP-N-acetylmuramate dehydrogenase [Candidatus Cyclobacteriaceae bacterium M2_1C_046]
MKIQEKTLLKSYNTFGIEATADFFTNVKTTEELQNLVRSDFFRREKILILGGGSNILFTENFPGLVIKMDIKGKEVIKEDEDHVWLKAGAGENWHQLVLYCIENNFGGLENLSLIPGTTGAAPMQNIGAYGVEIKDSFTYLEAVNIQNGFVEIFDHKACQFGYRESIFKNVAKGKYIITQVVFRLTKKNHQLNIDYGAIKSVLEDRKIKDPTIKDISDAVISIRQSKLPDPEKIGNAGSFFKNPVVHKEVYDQLNTVYPDMPHYPVDINEVKIPAAWLIDQCGWKGKRRHNIGVHELHTLVLVNLGGGKGKDLVQLSKDIQESVRQKFGIELQPEVNLV